MSSCRIERKRAHDREAQRASRAKTKAYIAHLEKTVADLTESSGDSRANYLAQHASKQAQEIEGLQALVGKIRTLINDASKVEQQPSPPADSPLCKAESPNAESNQEISSDSTPIEIDEAPSNATSSDSPRSEDRFSAEIPRSAVGTANETRSAPSSTRNLVVLGESMLCEETDDCDFFERLNRCIEKVEATPDHLSTLADDQDILIRAITQGWDAAERTHHFDIVWRFLRASDEGLWYRAQPLERLVHFWQMRSTMLHKICPKNQSRRKTPAFMNPTLQQMVATPHNLVADYYCWPKVRDRVIEQGVRGTSGRSSIAFTSAFRFHWSYGLRDTYMQNTTTGMYELQEGFLKAFNDLANYRLLPPKTLMPAQLPHPALTCADQASQESSLPWSTSRGEESPSSIASFDVQTDPLPVLADVPISRTQDTPSWMPSFSMDISSEAAFLEYAMDQWPVL